ncbi:MAG: hypothetical protein HYY17_00330 [Planctomycetes bacterium]|nr:hypothetical protein [Planctomycetota bacterium]
MRPAIVWLWVLSSAAFAQDQQVGARAKAMGGSYTAFEDDPVSVWLNPAGIATQPSAAGLDYQSYTMYELNISETVFSSQAATGWSDPALIPSYLGAVFQLGSGDVEHAVGLCFSAPFRTKYAFYDVATDLLTDMTQEYYRFRAAYAYDFRLKPRDKSGFLNHISVGGGIDLALTSVRIDQLATEASTTEPFSESTSAVGVGGGLGILIGLFDNTTNFKVNLGVAYQSRAGYDFPIQQSVVPQFDWPNQVNAGATFYLLEGQPLRLTFDLQWIDWDGATDDSNLKDFGSDDFRDVFNYSAGAEFRIKVSEKVRLFPRAGFRIFEAPWSDEEALPSIGWHLLFIETKKSRFTIFTFGLGVAWRTESGKEWKVDVAGDVGGDAPGFAFGFTLEI